MEANQAYETRYEELSNVAGFDSDDGEVKRQLITLKFDKEKAVTAAKQ